MGNVHSTFPFKLFIMPAFITSLRLQDNLGLLKEELPLALDWLFLSITDAQCFVNNPSYSTVTNLP